MRPPATSTTSSSPPRPPPAQCAPAAASRAAAAASTSSAAAAAAPRASPSSPSEAQPPLPRRARRGPPATSSPSRPAPCPVLRSARARATSANSLAVIDPRLAAADTVLREASPVRGAPRDGAAVAGRLTASLACGAPPQPPPPAAVLADAELGRRPASLTIATVLPTATRDCSAPDDGMPAVSPAPTSRSSQAHCSSLRSSARCVDRPAMACLERVREPRPADAGPVAISASSSLARWAAAAAAVSGAEGPSGVSRSTASTAPLRPFEERRA